MKIPFIFNFNVPREMIDELGHMHYLNHRIIAEKAHVAFLESRGLTLQSALSQGFILLMREDAASYHQEVREGDTLELHITATATSPACIEFNIVCTLKRGPAADIRYKMVTVNGTKVTPIKKTPFLALVV